MPNPNEVEIIDLTIPYYYNNEQNNIPKNNNFNVVIDLANDSFEEHGTCIYLENVEPKSLKECEDSGKKSRKSVMRKTKKVGICSICMDELGKNPLASTKCGHVYCLTCLKESLKSNKRCPTCRTILKGASAYHPLYLELH